MNARPPRPCPHAKSAGFTLVETLVALLVLAIGMLGIAALYVDTLRASRSALVRTQAVTLASDLADRIRSNRNPADAYTGAGLNALAQEDLVDWNALVAERLPGGASEVRFDAADPGIGDPAAYTIIVSWNEVGQADPATYELRIEI
jgi:type IV pilus assembly protein PilV